MKSIYVYADFDFLPGIEEVGILYYERVRGNDHFSFEFASDWLASHGDIILSGDISNSRGMQHPRNDIFGFVKDSFPDRWGRLLMDRRERILAKEEKRQVKALGNFDYLIGIEDFTRMGGLRYSEERYSSFAKADSRLGVPPIESLNELCEACSKIEDAEEKGLLPEQRWLNQLVDPGSSLGGARPKANVIDADGTLFIAKFPSKNDLENTELIEHFSHLVARKAGISTASTKVLKIKKNRDILLSERFDRNHRGGRCHFASAMALLGLSDGSGAETGNGYLDIVDFIVKGCTDVQENLRELYRRVAFNILFGNTDDHFRNHGFILTNRGWTLAPSYDLNPSLKSHQCLLIDGYSDASDINTLLDASESYLISREDAREIIAEVSDAIHSWKSLANENHIAPSSLEKYSERWDIIAPSFR